MSGQGFSSRSSSGRAISQGLPDPRNDPATDGAGYTEYHATIQSTGLDQALAPVYSSVVGVSNLDGNWYYDSQAQDVYSPRTTTKGKKYKINYVRASYTAEQLRTAQPLPRNNQLQTTLTSVPKDAYVDGIVAGLVKNQKTEYDKVRAIYNYFSRDRGFSYSLQTQTGTTGSDIANFLKNKVGFCQQYAAALAWMVRDAGIPARVAFGFTRGGTKDGNTYVITNRNAHAWAEVYFSGFGWVPFDATPAASVVGSARSGWAPDTDRPAVTPTTSGSAAPGGATGASAAPGGADKPERGGDNGGSTALGAGGSTGLSRNAIIGIVIGAVLLVLLLVPMLRRTLLRRHRHHATVPRITPAAVLPGGSPPGRPEVTVTVETVQAREDAHAAWDELIDTMIDYRVPVDPTETPRHTAARLVREADLRDRTAEGTVLLGTAEERARYARRPMQGVELTEALSQVRKGLAHQATLRTRLAAVLLPPSVLLHWRLALGDASAHWVGVMGRFRESTARFSPRRLLTRGARS